LKVLEISALKKRQEVGENCVMSCFHNLLSSPNIIRITKTMNGDLKVPGRRRPWPMCRHYHDIGPERVIKPMKNLRITGIPAEILPGNFPNTNL
jgi:hypothetical protein